MLSVTKWSEGHFSQWAVLLAIVSILVALLVAVLPASRVGIGVSHLLLAEAQGVPPHAGILGGSTPSFDWWCASTPIGWHQVCEEQLCGGCSDPCGGGEGGSCVTCEPTYNCTVCTNHPIYPSYEQCVRGGWTCPTGYHVAGIFYYNIVNDANAQWWQCNSNS